MAWKINPITGQLDYYEAAGTIICSIPPSDKCRVTNLYVDPDINKFIVKYDDVVGGEEGSIPSDPPTDKYRVINLYVDPTSGRLIVKYDDTPAE